VGEGADGERRAGEQRERRAAVGWAASQGSGALVVFG